MVNRKDSDGEIINLRKDGTTVGSIGCDSNSNFMLGQGDTGLSFQPSSDRIIPRNTDGSGRDNAIDLGGTGNRFKDLYLSGTAYSAALNVDGGSSGIINFGDVTSNYGRLYADSTGTYVGSVTANPLILRTTNTERARIDSSGNLLVGTTDTTPYNNNADSTADRGIALLANGFISAAAYQQSALDINRTGNDGNIANFYRSGTSVGSIGANGDALYISSPYGTDSGLKFASSIIAPSTTTGANRDAAIDLGYSSSRFKDLYLSGGAYLGGTGSANHLDDYEEGTFTPTVIGSTTAGTATYAHQKGVYTKVGNLVHVQIYLNWSSGTGAGNLQFGGLPFTQLSSSGYYASASIAEASNIAGTAGHQLGGLGQPNTVKIAWVEFDFASAPTAVAYDAAGYIVCSMSYRAE